MTVLDKYATIIDNKGMNKKILVFVVITIVALAAAVYSLVLYQQSQEQIKKLKNPQELARVETKELVETVGKLIDLPSETPTIATVTDSNKLKNQQFFEKAQNGDKVLIYTQAKKAILYSPSKNKIINVGPINIGQAPTVKPTAEPSGKSGTPTVTPKPSSTVVPTVKPTVSQ